MIIRETIRGQEISFCVSPALDSQAPRVRAQIAYLVTALNMIPLVHLNLLGAVPIVIWQRHGDTGTGGWVSPTEGTRANPGDLNDRYDAWLNGRRGRRFGVQAELSSCPHTNGIIHMTDYALFRPAWACQLTLLHETGHCVDYHLDLNSRPVGGEDAYRNGNRAYQGQRYRSTGYNNHEFKPETYSRLFIRPNALCRRGRASPSCEHSRGHTRCNERLRRDLANSPAFAITGAEGRAVLGLTSTPSEGEDHTEVARGPAERVVRAGENAGQLLSSTQAGTAGPKGCALQEL